jgi:REP element-mobilizing transposase RayT
MRTARIKGDEGQGHYHCMSRIIERRMLLGREEKVKLRDLVRKAEAFCGVQVLTYAIVSNHFHVLVAVPYRREVSDAELIRRDVVGRALQERVR